MPYAPGLSFWDSWYRVRCPVLLLRGERSQVLPPHVARTMQQARPDTRIEEIAGCGHAPSLMAEEQIALVRDFLSAVAPSRERARDRAVSSGARHEPRQPLHSPRPA
jgi:pimeloyl-ACP methyl ester carboxylesterase